MNDLETIKNYLRTLGTRQYSSLVLKHCKVCETFRASILDEIKSKKHNVEKMFNDLKKEVNDLSNKAFSHNGWFTPQKSSFSKIVTRMRLMIDIGEADVLFNYTDEFLYKLHEIQGSCHDPLDMYVDVESCIETLVDALKKSTLPDAEKLIWAMERSSVGLHSEDYECPFSKYLESEHPKETWSEVADILISRLNGESDENDGRYSVSYAKEPMFHWILNALKFSGRISELQSLYELQARKTMNSAQYIDFLIENQHYDDAMRLIQDGLSKTEDKDTRKTRILHGQLIEVYANQANWSALLLCELEDFVGNPSVQRYVACKDAAERISDWGELRKTLLGYVEEGVLPWENGMWPLAKYSKDMHVDGRVFPMIDKRILIAVHEKNVQDALTWVDRLDQASKIPNKSLFDAVATLAQNESLERSLDIWKSLVQQVLDDRKINFRFGIDCLYKIKSAMLANDLEKEWDEYIASIRETYKVSRRSIMPVINRI
jgi:uncharacterized Zn finger protein